MALATTCPQCKTSFRVVPDQLKLRRGLVRCGVCRHVFSGIDSLRYLEEPRSPSTGPVVAPAAFVPAAFVPAAIRQPAVEPSPGLRPEPTEPEPIEPEPIEPEPIEPEPIEPEPIEPEPIEPEPIEPEPIEPGPVAAPDRRSGAAVPAGSSAIAPPPAVPDAPGDEADAVDFFAPDRRPGGFASRGAAFASVASVALAALLLLQLVIGGRDWLASRVPALGTALVTVLGPLGLRVQPPREPGALTIESFELQPAGSSPTLFALSALLRNRTGHVVQWPALELSLLDGGGEVVVRKLLEPADYLGAASPALREGVRGRAEVPLRAAIEVLEGSPTGYRVRIVDP